MTGERQIIYSGQDFSLKGEKGRFVLPSAFRKTVAQSSDGKTLCLDKHHRWNCLVGFGLSRESELEDQLEREEERAFRLGKDFDVDARLDPALYAAHGGVFPLTIAGVGVVGTVGVSGLPQADDHAFVVEQLRTYLAEL